MSVRIGLGTNGCVGILRAVTMHTCSRGCISVRAAFFYCSTIVVLLWWIPLRPTLAKLGSSRPPRPTFPACVLCVAEGACLLTDASRG